MQLYSYQSASVAAIMAGLQQTGRALLHLATGLGKTVIMREVTKKYAKQRVLFLVHDTDILEQNMERFAELFQKFGEVGIYHGTDKSGFDARIVFATFQTMIKDKDLFGSDAFALILVDEAHHAPAETYQAVIDYFDGHKLGASATIERLDELKVEDIFGEPVISIELEEAIAKGYLTPFSYKVMSDGLNAGVLEKLLEEAETTRRMSIEDINKTLFIDKRDEEIVAHIKEEAGDRKTLVFCRNIDHANRVVKLLGERAVTTHSKLKGDAAKEPLKLFRQGRVQYLVVVNKANEGVDIPDAEVVVFLRATESKIIFFQQLGRTLRKSDGKELALVLDFVGSLERLAMVRSMARDIEDLADPKNGGGQASMLTISGDGFDFDFDEKVVQALDLFDRLRDTSQFYSYTEAQAKVQEMGILTRRDYLELYRSDQRLPSSPYRIYEGAGWTSWSDFLKTSTYPSYEEAREKVQKLGIASISEYQARYKEDPRLPSSPHRFYGEEFVSSYDFFGKEEVAKDMYTYTEAQAKVQELGIKSGREYHLRYKQDSRLPSNPNKKYVEDWESWSVFLGIKKSVDFYTYSQAMKRVKELKITTVKQYSSRRGEDPKLPGNPDYYYKDQWESWVKFLTGKDRVVFYTYPEACQAVLRLSIDSRASYIKRYKEDRRLPSNPDKKYGDDWVSWDVFIGKE